MQTFIREIETNNVGVQVLMRAMYVLRIPVGFFMQHTWI